jgi:hypothetical protein
MKTLLKDALPGAQTSLCKVNHDARQRSEKEDE